MVPRVSGLEGPTVVSHNHHKAQGVSLVHSGIEYMHTYSTANNTHGMLLGWYRRVVPYRTVVPCCGTVLWYHSTVPH